MTENTPHKALFCQRCEKEIAGNIGVCYLSLPPHDFSMVEKICFDCGIELAYKYSLENQKEEDDFRSN